MKIDGYMVRDELDDMTRCLVDTVEDSPMVDVSGPMLSDEVDEQAWQVEAMVKRPAGAMRAPACGPFWKPADYRSIALYGKAVAVPAGGMSVTVDEARARLREGMSQARVPVSCCVPRVDPWGLRGDRVSAPEAVLVTDQVSSPSSVGVELGVSTVAELLAVSDANLEAAMATMAGSDALLVRLAGAVTRDDEDDDPKPVKPLIYKSPEPPPRFRKDDWGFPLDDLPPAKTDPSAGSEPQQPEGEPVPEEPSATPPTGQLGPEGSAAAASQGTGSPIHVRMVGMNTRVQLTGRMNGDYSGAANFEVEGAGPMEVLAVLEVIKAVALARHNAAVGAGTARARGGNSVRIQLQPKRTEEVDGRVVKAAPRAGDKWGNLSVLGMSVDEVEPLVNHQLKLHFGVVKGDAAELVKAWSRFEKGEPKAPTVSEPKAGGEGTEGPGGGDLRKDMPGAVGTGGGSASDFLRDLVGKSYSRKLHLGLCAVVSGSSLKVLSLWESEEEAKAEARRVGARVVDAEGYLVPEAEVEARA